MKNIIEWNGIRKKDFFFENNGLSIDNLDQDFIFSIVIAIYNSEEYIDKTLNSVLTQDFDFSKIQLILVDDGSTDNSYEICKSYALKYPSNITLIHKKNGGVSQARNVGTLFATGKYINYLDSDDLFSSNVCSEVYNFFEANQNKTDVVTIKVSLFGDKNGNTWFNKKFEKGNRIINLFKEPAIYLNSTNNTFFHRRIKNQLFFDESLTIAEDLKVVNTALMNKYTLGVINTCEYYYRIRNNGSLVSTAKRKEVWYFTYLEKVFFWLYEKSVKQTGRFLEFLQYTLLRELYNRINNNVECVDVINDKDLLESYKNNLFKALSLIDDKVIKNNNFLNTDFMLYIFSKKYGVPTIELIDEDIHFKWNEDIDIVKKLYACYELCSVKNNKLILEGYVVVNNIQYDLKNIGLNLKIGNEVNQIPFIEGTKNDLLAFADEYILYRKYFKITLPLPKEKIKLNLSLSLEELNLPIQIYGYEKWFGVDKSLPESYFYQKRFLLTIEESILCVNKGSRFTALKHERRFLKRLRHESKKEPIYKKTYKLRLYYLLGRLIHLRKIWIVSDRCINAGDNGEAFYFYMKKKKMINTYFALNSDSSAYPKLKKRGAKLLAINSVKYKKKCLLADKIISAHFDHSELIPIEAPYLNDIKAKKMHVFLQHGITKDDVSKFYNRKRQKIDCFVTAANPEYLSILNNSNYFCDQNIVKLTGFPRYDILESKPEKIILIMPTWRNNLISFEHNSKNPKIDKNFTSSPYYTFFHSLLNDERLRKITSELGYKIYYFPHSNMVATNCFFEDIPGIKIIEGNERNYNSMFSKASIMVTDYSSTAFDFAYLRKPIIYCQKDSVEFFHHHTYTKGYFDYEQDGFGRVTKEIDETVDEIISLLNNQCVLDEKYLKRINDFFYYSDKENCKRVYKVIKGEDLK